MDLEGYPCGWGGEEVSKSKEQHFLQLCYEDTQ